MTKVAINIAFGGFHFSAKALELLKERLYEFKKHSDKCGLFSGNRERSNPILISVIEQLGDEASARKGEIKIVEIPDDVDWYVDDYDGKEWVAEVHKTWQYGD